MNRYWFLVYLSILLLTQYACSYEKGKSSRAEDASYVWIDSTGEGRQVYLVFRRDFNLTGPAEGEIHLYANSRYHLYVNGTFVNFGPVRAYPEHPEYDSYDLTPYLQKGENFIAVKVMNNGVTTYQVPNSSGGFIAWGGIGKKTDLSTPGDWKVSRLTGYDPTSPKMTFATGPLESYDERKEDITWNEPGADISSWKIPVLLADQEHFGSLSPRSIPFLTQDEYVPESCLGIYNLKDDEDFYSFRVKSADSVQEAFNSNKIAFAYTYIYSPKKQTIDAGLWWGDFYLNDRGPLQEYKEVPEKFYRRDYPLELEKGWNYFFIRYGIVWASWDFYMAVPKAAGLIFSPTRDPSSEYIFRTAGPFPDKEEEAARQKEVPFVSEVDIEDLSVEWEGKKRNSTAGNPALNIAWSYFEDRIDHDPARVTDIHLGPSKGKALVFDMGGKTLGRVFIDYEAPEGTTVDIGFTEDLYGNRPWIMKRVGLYMGARHVSAGGRTRFETFKPYGTRYLHINITGHSDSVYIHKTGMVSQIYPFEKNGSFECSDPMMNEIWELGWRTLQVCSEDTYTDTPFRERGLYAGDALPEYAITLATSGDSRLIKRSISVFADMYRNLMIPGGEDRKDNVNAMGDFPLITLQFYAWSVIRTGDLDFARQYYDGYKHMMNVYTEKKLPSGLVDHGKAFIEWTQIDKNATLTTIQSLVVQSLGAMAIVADKLGKPSDAENFRTEASAIKEKMNELCWDEKAKAYSDGFRDGVQINHHYPISSAWPVWFQQVPENRKAAIRKHFRETLTDIGDRDRQRLATPYGSFYLLGALYELGMEDLAEFYIRKYWSPMILKHGDTAWENFGDGSDGSGQGTLSHAWSGGPTWYLSTRALGVRMEFPGFKDPDQLLIAPQVNDIRWARGKVPHPKGIIHVDWKVEGDILFLDYDAPEDVMVNVEPLGKLKEKKLIVNSRELF